MRKFEASFPHPIFGISDDVSGELSANGSVQIGKDFCELSVLFHTNNEYFLGLIKSSKASFVVEVHCDDTVYRDFFKTENINDSFVINIPTEKIKGQVEVYFYICSNGKMVYESDSFNQDYHKIKFDISNGDIIGYRGKTYFFVDKYDPTLKKSSSIMTVTRSEKGKETAYDFDEDKINIYVPSKDYDVFRNTNAAYADIYLSVLAYPAMTSAIRKYCDDHESVADRRWAIAIEHRAERDSEIASYLEAKDTASGGVSLIAQKILDFPITKSINRLDFIDKEFSRREADDEI